MMQFTDKYPCTLTNRSTGVTVDVMQGHAEWMVKICNSPMLTDLWLDVGGKREGLVGEAMEYILTQRDLTLWVRAHAYFEESSIFSGGSEKPITVLHLYVNSCKKI